MEHNRAGSSACASCRYRRDRDRFFRSFHAHEGAYHCDIIARGCGKARGILGGFSFARRTNISRSIHAAQGESLPYNHQLHQFLTFLKHERGFADATIVNRERSLKPFLGWLVAEDVPLSTVSPVVINKYFTGIVAGRWKRTTVPFHVQSLRSFFRYASG